MARLLIVDDSDPAREAASRCARAGGHHVAEADSGEAALERLDRERFDAVLLDVVMPTLDGFETCRLLRARPGGDDVPVLFMTGLDERRALDGAVAAGADDVLLKPFRAAELELRVRALVRTYELLRAERAAAAVAVRQRRELEQLVAQREALAEFVVHDLKSPLASVAFTIQELLDTPVPEHCRTSLRACLGATDTASRMVMNLLDLSGARLDAHPRPSPVDALLEHLRDCFAVRLEVRGVALVTRAGVAAVRADRELLRRVAENLVDNALRYAPAGSEVEVAIEPEPTGAALIVIDRGPGVPAAHRERVFDRFVQLDPEASQRASRGLGLAFCRLAMDAHGGTITVDDAPGGGARFRAWFPDHAPGGGA